MRQRPFAGFGLLVALLLTVLPVLGRPAAAQNDLGLGQDNSYESPQFGYSVAWGDDWTARTRDVTSNEGGFDTLTLRSGAGTLRISGQSSDDVTAAEAVERRIGIEIDSDDDIVSEDLESDVPTADLQVGRSTILIEGHTLEDEGAVLVLVLTARESNFDDALASVQDQVLINDSPILAGESLGTAGVPTEEATEEATETPVDLVPTEEATEEPTEEATEEATEAPTEAPTEEATEAATAEATETNVVGNTYTSPVYGYSFEWDEDLWTVSYESADDTSDALQLTADTGSMFIWSWDGYGDDPVACLDGESDYYENEDPTISDWVPAENADGEPIRDEGRDYAYGVYRLTYTDPDDENAEPVELVDYIECRSIPDQDAVVIIFGSAPPDQYNDHLDNLLDVADTIAFGEAPVVDETPESTPEDVTPEDVTPESGLSGSTYTSPSFGFSLEIPSSWTVEDEQLDANDERLMLSNGVSDVTLWATDSYAGDLEGCIGYVIDGVTLQDREIDRTADGGPFRGSDANGAYANFVYTGDAGEQRAFFVACRYIVEDESVLILTQDVAYDDYTSQRQERRALQDAIVLP